MIDKATRIRIYEAACTMLDDGECTPHVRTEYSGRGMYGATCPAIVFDEPITEAMIGAAICMAAHVEGVDDNDSIDIIYDVVPQRRDNMGLGWIVY